MNSIQGSKRDLIEITSITIQSNKKWQYSCFVSLFHYPLLTKIVFSLFNCTGAELNTKSPISSLSILRMRTTTPDFIFSRENGNEIENVSRENRNGKLRISEKKQFDRIYVNNRNLNQNI